MNTKIKILIAEHDPVDIDLMTHELKKGGINYVAEIVQTEKDFENALRNFNPDIILSDYTMPSFNGQEAFKLKERISPEVPFIFVSGTIGEENSIEQIKLGATDYVLKDRLLTLPFKITRALKDAMVKKEKLKADLALIDNTRQLLRAQEIAHIGSWEVDLSSNIVIWSEEACKIYGFSYENNHQTFHTWLTFVHPDDVEFAGNKIREAFITFINSSFSFRFLKDGNIIKHGCIEWRFEFDENQKPIRLNGILQDITERKETDEKINKANNLYAFISQVNQNIVRVKDKEKLFRNSCRIATEYGKFKIAWIGLYTDSLDKIKLTHQSGLSDTEIDVFTNGISLDNGPQKHVLQTGNYYLCNDIENEPELKDWHAFALRNDIRSGMVLPIRQSGKIIGTFNLYSTRLNFSDKEEIALMVDISNDISFALDLLDKEKIQTETEQLLVNNENRFRNLIEKSTDMITLSNIRGEVFYGSPSITEVFGYSLKEIYDTPVLNSIHPDDTIEFLNNREKVLKTPGESVYNEIRLKHKDGRWIWMEGTLTNLLHEPSINAIVSNFRDISEKKLVEEIRQFDENNLYALINNTEDLMWSLDKDLKLITCNQPFSDLLTLMTGQTPEKGSEVITETMPRETIEHYQRLYERALTGEAFTITEYNAIPVDNWSEISFYPIRDGEEIIGTACHSHNITERKIADKKLRESEKGLKESQAISHLGNWELDFSTGIALWSEEACRIYGLPSDQLQNSYEIWKSFIYPEDLDRVMEITTEAQKTFSNSDFYHRVLLKNGTIKHIHSISKFVFDATGKPTGLYGIAHDVTELKETERELRKSEAFNNGVLNSLSSHIAVVDGSGTIVAVNDAWNRFSSSNGEFMLSQTGEGSNYFRVCEKAAQSGDLFAGDVLEGIKDVLDGKRAVFYLEYPCHAPFEKRWFGVRIMKFENDQEMVVVAHQNITERLLAEEKLISASHSLQQTLNDLNKIMHYSMDTICTIDEDGRFVTVSKASKKIWGYEPEELKGKAFMDLVFSEDIEKTGIAATEIMSGAALSNFENRYIHKDGSIVPILWSATWDDNDKIMYCIAKDVTESKKLEQGIENERQRFNEMFFEAPSSMGILRGPDHIFETANPLYLELIGNNDIIGKTVKDVLPEIESQGFIEILDNVYKTGKTFSANEMNVKIDKLGDGTLSDFYLNFLYQPFRNNEGDIEGIFFFVIDATEQVISRRKVEASEAKLKEAQAIAHTGNWEIDLANDSITWSDELFNIFGVRKEDTIVDGDLLFSFVHPEDLAGIRKSRKESFDTLLDSSHNFRFIRADGSLRYGYIERKFEFDKKNKPIRFYGIVQDVTERKLAELLIIESEGRLAEAQSIGKIGNWETDLKTQKVIWSAETYRIFGLNPDDFQMSHPSFLEHVHPDDRQEVDKAFVDSSGNHGINSIEHRIITPAGLTKIIEERWRIEYDDSGTAVKATGTSQDITDRKKAELDNKFKAKLLNTIGQAVMAMDLDGVVNFWNKASVEMYGYTSEEAIGKNIAELNPSIQSHKHAQEIMNLLAQGKSWSGEFPMQRKDGSNFPAFVSDSPVLDDHGKLVGVIGVSNDITERKNAEIKLENQNKELLKTNSELDRFVYSVSHDLRAPLSSMLGIIEISLDITEEELMQEHLKMLKGNVKKLDGFIGDILDYSRNSRVEVKTEKINFNELLGEITQNLKYMGAANRTVDIRINIDEKASFHSDKSRLSIILSNLISNAIRYQNPAVNDPFVDVRITTSSVSTTIIVSDNGIGIRQEQLDKIFIMFYRVSEESIGSGLGLYIVKEAVDKLKGSILTESEPGKGTKFIIKLPAPNS